MSLLGLFCKFYTDYECVNLFYLQNTPVTPRGRRLSNIFRRQVKNHPWKLSLICWGVKFAGCEEALTLDAENKKGIFALPKCLLTTLYIILKYKWIFPLLYENS